MIVACDNCQTRFKLADEKITPRGVKIRCSQCGTVFTVKSEASGPSGQSGGEASGFSLDGFGADVGAGGAGGSEFGGGPLGIDGPAPKRPDRPARPAPGQEPPPRSATRPKESDRVFDTGQADISTARQMGVDFGSQKEPGDGGEFDNLEDLFGPSKSARAAAGAPRPPGGRGAPSTGDPFSDARTLDTERAPPQVASPSPPQAAPGDSDPFGGLFESSAVSGERESGHEEPSTTTGEEFNTLLSGEGGGGDFFGGGSEAASQETETKTRATREADPENPDHSVRWGPRKKASAGEVETPLWPKLAGAVGGMLVLILAFRGLVEFAPELFLDGGMSYESLSALRRVVPFVATNSDFPQPQSFYEVSLGRSYVIENQFGKRLFVVEGKLTNKGPGARSFFSVQAQAFDADGQPVGAPEIVFAGNELDVEALKRLPLVKVRESLRVKFGPNGINFDVPVGRTLSFMLVFTGWDREPATVQVVKVDAIAASG